MKYGKNQIEKLSNELTDLTQDLQDLELDLFSAVKKLMHICWFFLTEFVKEWEKMLRDLQNDVKRCSECNHKLYTIRKTYPELIFPFGRIAFMHRKVRCPACGYKDGILKWWIPQGLNTRITPLVGEKLIWLSGMLPYREVQYYLQSFWDLDISLRGIQHYVSKIGGKVIHHADLLKGQLDLHKQDWDKVYNYVDGVMVFINNRWREVKVGVIECYRNGQVSYFYHSEKSHWKTFLQNMYTINEKLGCTTCKVKLFISDAGRGITSHAPGIFKDYRFLIDYYHASEHISVFLNHLGETRKVVLSELRNQLTSLLYKGKIKELVGRMETLRCGKKNKILQREVAYFKNHESLFDFATFRQHKWNIGSGRIESACRWLIQQRFKLSGMRWKSSGFELILNLRLAFYNSRLFPAYKKVSTHQAA
jgi:hypothetical protein